MYKEKKMKRKYFFAVLLSLIICFIPLNKKVLAVSINNPALHSYDINLFSENQNFNMPRNSAACYFNIPKDALLNNDCYVNIHYAVSKTLIDNLSSMSLSVNGVYIDTEWIKDIEEISPNYWKVAITVDKLKAGGINEIKVESNHRSIIGDCADIDNAANWVTIYDDSKIHISDKSVYSPALSDFYPSYFDDFGSNQYLTSNFIISDTKIIM
jgi:Bacterial cellulose synthase subunit.